MKTPKIFSVLSRNSISRRAYELWEQHGAPEGQDLAFWLQAEEELAHSVTNPSNTIDRERLYEFLDTFGCAPRGRSPTALNFT